MGQTAQIISEDQSGVGQTIPKIVTSSNMGTFRSGTTEVKKVTGTGPVFTSNNKPMVGLSEIKPTNTNYNILENIDIRRLVSILTQEAIKIGNLDNERVTEKDRRKILQALYALNPKKYPFSTSEEKITPEKETSSVITFPTLNNTDTNVVESSNFLTKVSANDPEFKKDEEIQNNKIVKTILRSNKAGKLGTPKNTTRLAKIEVQKELDRVESEKPKELSNDLFDQLHSQISQPTIEVIAPVNEITLETLPQETFVNQSTKPENTNEEKTKSVGKLFDTRTKNCGGDWRYLAVATPMHTNKTDILEDHLIPKDIHMEQIPSWRELSAIDSVSTFLNELNKINEESLITKYVSSYVNPNNPSSWASVSDFSAYEIIGGPESVYGLMPDARLEVSTLLKYLGVIDEATDFAQTVKKYSNGKFHNYQDYISLNPKLTIHDYYEEIRKRIADADKYEKK